MMGFLKNLIVRDFWLKLFSFALALLIWELVSPAVRKQMSPTSTLMGTAVEQTFSRIPLEVVASAADVHSFRVTPSEVEVTLRGEKKLLQSLQLKDVRALVDLTGIESAGNMRKRIEVITPPGITYDRVAPAEADVVVPPKP